MNMDQERVQRAREMLGSARLDAVVSALSSNVLMLSGYAPVLGQSILVFPAEGDAVLVVPEDEIGFAREGWWPDVRPYGSSVLNAGSSDLDLARPILRKAVSDLGLEAARFGFEGSWSMVPASYSQVGFPGTAFVEALRESAPGGNFVDVSPLLTRESATKTAPEVERMRRAADVAAVAFEGARTAIRDGATEARVAAAAQAAAQVRGRHYGITRLVPFVHVMSGPRSEKAYQAYNLTADRTIVHGDPVLVQVEIYADGFWSEVTRTFFVGTCGPEGARIYETCLEAQKLAIDAVRAGVAAAEVDRQAREYIAGAGFGRAFRHGTGHGVGFQAISHLHPPRVAPGSTDTIQEGMTFNVEPAIYLHGWGGCRVNDTVVARAAGAEIITRIPRDLNWAVIPQVDA